MFIKKVRIAGNELILQTNDKEAIFFANEFKPGEYELRRVRKKRSLDANSYCWELASKIARVVKLTKEEVYRRNIRDVGVCTAMPIKAEAVEEFRRIWGQRGIGWFVDVVDDGSIDGYKLCLVYQGSSTYDTAQMSRLIDNLIQDAQAVGICTIGEREKSLMLEGWAR